MGFTICLFVCYCNSSGVVTVLRGNHNDSSFVTLLCDRNSQNAALSFHLFSVLCLSIFFGNFYPFSFSVPTQSLLCTVFVVLIRKGKYRNDTPTLSGRVSIEVLPVSEQWLF
jgi:hypothetical protein